MSTWVKHKKKNKLCKYQGEITRHYYQTGIKFEPGVAWDSKDPVDVEVRIAKRREFFLEHGYLPVRDLEHWKNLLEVTPEGLFVVLIKYCPRCRIIKPRCEFRANKLRNNGIESQCKECHRVRCRQYGYDRYERYQPKVTEQWRYIKQLQAVSKRLLKNLKGLIK